MLLPGDVGALGRALPAMHACTPGQHTTHRRMWAHTRACLGGRAHGNGSASLQAANPGMLLLSYCIPELLGRCVRW